MIVIVIVIVIVMDESDFGVSLRTRVSVVARLARFCVEWVVVGFGLWLRFVHGKFCGL